MKTYHYILFLIGYIPVLTYLLLHPALSRYTYTPAVSAIIGMELQTPSVCYLGHFVMFLLLSFCFSQIGSKKLIWFWLVLLLFYATGTELLQEYIPPRSFRYADLAQNVLGIIVGLFFGYYLKHVRGKIE